MEELTIALQFNANDFKEIYYAGKRERNVLTSRQTKGPLRLTLTLSGLSVMLYPAANKAQQATTIFLFVICCLLTAASLVYCIVVVTRFYMRVSGINVYLKSLSKYRSFNLHLGDKTIELAFDEELTIDRWENIKRMVAKPSYVQLQFEPGNSLSFPKKSMTEEQFAKLQEFVKEKIRQDRPIAPLNSETPPSASPAKPY